jgi:hypothetical protein
MVFSNLVNRFSLRVQIQSNYASTEREKQQILEKEKDH